MVQLRTTIRFFNILGTVARQGVATTSRSAAVKEKGNPQQKQRGRKQKPKESKKPKQAKAKKSAPAKTRPSAAPPFILPATLPPTDALYLLDTYQLESTATVLATVPFSSDPKSFAVVTNKTIFHAQGGGQPGDSGTMQTTTAKFNVSQTVWVKDNPGVIAHIGSFEPPTPGFEAGTAVKQMVDRQKRLLNAANHSSGHLIDVAMSRVGCELPPLKGYHFPAGPYVEYIGRPDKDNAELKELLNECIAGLVREAIPTKVQSLPREEVPGVCGADTDISHLDPDKDVRVVFVGSSVGIPCGGTHIQSTADLAGPDGECLLSVSKLKVKKGNLKVSYRVSSK